MAPLDDVRVLDLTHAYAGPLCTQQLRLCGAQVYKVEPAVEGDDFRSRASFFAMNSGKRSITIDLKRPEGREVLYRLAEGCDVLVENYRPGVAEHLGVDWATMHERFPRLLYCSITGFGSAGSLRDRAAIEWVIQAMSGVTSMFTPEGADPRWTGPGMADAMSGYVAFSAVLTGLLERHRTGMGQFIDVSMLEAVMVLQTASVLSSQGGASRGANGSSDPLRSTMARYQTKDGPIFIAMLLQRWFETVARRIGRPELIDDPRYADNAGRMAAGLGFVRDIEEGLKNRTAAEWEVELAAAHVPVGMVRTAQQGLELSAHRERRFVRTTRDLDGTEKVVLGLPFSLGEREEVPSERVPALGESTEAILAELGFSASEVAELKDQKIV